MQQIKIKPIIDKPKKIYRKHQIIYFLLWTLIVVLGIIVDIFRKRFDFLLAGLNLYSLFVFFIVFSRFSGRNTYRKKFYTSQFFIVGVILVSFTLGGLILLDPILNAGTLIITLGLIGLVPVNFEREVYRWGVNKFNLKKKDQLILLPCPECEEIIVFTIDNDEEPNKKDMICKECGFDLREEYDI